MRSIFFFLVVLVVATTLLFPQVNAIQSIDFDSQQRVVYGLSGPYDTRIKFGLSWKTNYINMMEQPGMNSIYLNYPWVMKIFLI